MNRRGSYFKNLAIGLDQFVGTIFGIPADITISGYVGWKSLDGELAFIYLERIINFIFRDSKHCRNSIEWDQIIKYYGKGD